MLSECDVHATVSFSIKPFGEYRPVVFAVLPAVNGDERRARQIADRMGKKAVGTLRLLARLNLEGRAPELPELVRILRRDLDFRVSDEIVLRAVDLAAEPI